MSKTEIIEHLARIDEHLERVDAVIAGIGHNSGPPLDEPPPLTHEGLMPDRLVAEQRYHIAVRTLERWDKTPGLGFPPAVRINGRRYREVDKLDEWDLGNARKAVDSHNRRAVAQALPRARAGRFSKPRNIEAR